MTETMRPTDGFLMSRKETGGTRNQRKNQDHPDHSTFKTMIHAFTLYISLLRKHVRLNGYRRKKFSTGSNHRRTNNFEKDVSREKTAFHLRFTLCRILPIVEELGKNINVIPMN